ncbi:MAG: thioredoxin domain-containing protein [Candidatus Odinarchaeia archaeon]
MSLNKKIVSVRIPITRMPGCPKCRLDMDLILKSTKGIKNVEISYTDGEIFLEYDYTLIDLPEIENKVKTLGYEVIYDDIHSKKHDILKSLKIKEVREDNYDILVNKTIKPVILFFTDSVDGDKTIIKNVLKVIKKFKSNVYFYLIDCKSTRSLCDDYTTMTFPKIILLKEGNIIDTFDPVDVNHANSLKSRIKTILKS